MLPERDPGENKTANEIRREFKDIDSERYSVFWTGGVHDCINIHREGRAVVAITTDMAPELARLILEVHAEATAPKPMVCPWCGGPTATCVDIDFSYVECESISCGAMGPNLPTKAEAIEAWKRIRIEGEK